MSLLRSLQKISGAATLLVALFTMPLIAAEHADVAQVSPTQKCDTRILIPLTDSTGWAIPYDKTVTQELSAISYKGILLGATTFCERSVQWLSYGKNAELPEMLGMGNVFLKESGFGKQLEILKEIIHAQKNDSEFEGHMWALGDAQAYLNISKEGVMMPVLLASAVGSETGQNPEALLVYFSEEGVLAMASDKANLEKIMPIVQQINTTDSDEEFLPLEVYEIND
mgnify:CR=1 FL=1